MNLLTHSFPLFSFRGIITQIHWTTILFFAFFLMYTSPFEFYALLVAFLSLIPHEYGHALAGKLYGIKTHSITILPVGGMALMEQVSKEPKTELVVVGAGPAVTLGLALLFLPFALLFPNQYTVAPVVINVALFIFNLIPLFPMDGGRFFRAFMACFLSHETATIIAVRSGQVLAAGLGLLGIFIGAPMLTVTMIALIFAGEFELGNSK